MVSQEVTMTLNSWKSVGYVSGKQSNMLPQVVASLECVFHMFNYLSDIVQEYKG